MYRIGDADRERGLALLRRHYADGRITVDELADRVDVVAAARTTAELRTALRDLPGGRALATVIPRAIALRETPLGETVTRRAVRLVVCAALLGAWLFASVVMLAALAVAQLAVGGSSELALAFLLAWLALTWLAVRLWRGGSRHAERR